MNLSKLGAVGRFSSNQSNRTEFLQVAKKKSKNSGDIFLKHPRK